MLIVSSVDSIRNLPSAALFGPSLIFFYILAALVFLIPTAYVSAKLSSALHEEGGIYHWVRTAFGAKWAMLAIWLQWINTMIWCPTILAFISGVVAYLIHPELANNKYFLMGGILVIFWILTFFNLFGVQISARITAICATIGTILPIFLLIALGFIWIGMEKTVQIDITLETIFIPGKEYWTSLVAIAGSFLGIELAGVHSAEIHNPQKNFPKAIFFSCSIIFSSMLFGSLAIAYVLPAHQINLVAGSMEAIAYFFNAFGLGHLSDLIVILIVIGSIGGLINWVISPAKGLLHAAEFGFLPPFLRKKNNHGVSVNILLIQAVIVTFISSLFLLISSVNAFYWFLLAISTELYMLMYILMFLSAIHLRNSIPAQRGLLFAMILLGLFGTTLITIVSFIPPPHVELAQGAKYALLIGISNVVAILPVVFFFRYKKKKNHQLHI